MEYGPIPVSRYSEVIEHLRYNFFPDEPLNNSIGLCQRGKPHTELEGHSLETLKDEMSIMATDKQGQIAGVALNGILKRGDIVQAQAKLLKVKDEKFQKIFGLLYCVNRELDLFCKYNVDKIFEFRILSVDGKHRGAGLAKQLMMRSELIAEEYGFKVFKVDATSFFSQRACKNLGLSVEIEVRYSDYKDEEGRPLFPTQPPHDTLKVMTKILGCPPNSG